MGDEVLDYILRFLNIDSKDFEYTKRLNNMKTAELILKLEK